MTLKLCFTQVRVSWKRTGIKYPTRMREWWLLIKMQRKKIGLICQFQDTSQKLLSLPQRLQLVGCVTVVSKWLRAHSCYVPWVHPQNRTRVWETHIVWVFDHSFKSKLSLGSRQETCRQLPCLQNEQPCFSRDFFFHVWKGNVPFLYETVT